MSIQRPPSVLRGLFIQTRRDTPSTIFLVDRFTSPLVFEAFLHFKVSSAFPLWVLTMSSGFITGFLTGAALIIAIGAQNAFVLRQGLRREHVWQIVMICALADASLIAAGIAGLGSLIQSIPVLFKVTWAGGAVFLLWYGYAAARRALQAKQMLPQEDQKMSRRAALTTCMAFTFLNPHVYLDTVILLGSLANQAGPTGRWSFGIGAMAASFSWFMGLGYGAQLLAPLFRNNLTWRLLDSLVAVTMFSLGLKLLCSSS